MLQFRSGATLIQKTFSLDSAYANQQNKSVVYFFCANHGPDIWAFTRIVRGHHRLQSFRAKVRNDDLPPSRHEATKSLSRYPLPPRMVSNGTDACKSTAKGVWVVFECVLLSSLDSSTLSRAYSGFRSLLVDSGTTVHVSRYTQSDSVHQTIRGPVRNSSRVEGHDAEKNVKQIRDYTSVRLAYGQLTGIAFGSCCQSLWWGDGKTYLQFSNVTT